jgi:hypothetical protein
MTVKRIPVRVHGTRPRRPDPTIEAARDERPQAAPVASPASEAATQPDDTSAPDVNASEPCAGRPVPETGPEQDGLLFDVLSVADNLERALAVAQEDTPIRQGVAITHRDVLRLLRRHGLERIEAHDRPFDPHWHEAVDVVPARDLGVDPGTVVRVMVSGYRRGERLFRPARVVVAQ